MRPLRYTINITVDGCSDHRASHGDEALHRYVIEGIVAADALLFGRVTYQMMESAWREPSAMPEWTRPFARTIGAAKKYVVSSTLDRVDWNAELVRGDLGAAVRQLKEAPGRRIFVSGTQLARSLTELELIDEYEFIIHPRIVGRGPTIFAGLSKPLDLTLVDRVEFGSGFVALRYAAKR
ncbi:MAG: dihydrofolate reductase family protein [Nannocystaceae bacterium]